MSQKKRKPVVRTPSKKTADARRIRFGSGTAPAVIVRSGDAATADAQAIRFGSGTAPAVFRK
jgi:hypothetical protein